MSFQRFDARDLVAIGVGGVLGAAVRWWISGSMATSNTEASWFEYAPNATGSFAPGSYDFAWGTLTVNVVGCLVLGIVTALLMRSAAATRPLLAVGTGFCGSLTTFSTFAVDAASALRGQLVSPTHVTDRSLVLQVAPHRGAAMAYLVLSVVFGGAAFWFGRTAAHRTSRA